MKITAVRTVVVNAEMRNWVLVRVETDHDGLFGWGEATLEWKTRAVVGAIDDLAPLILGRDPRDITALVRIMRKHGFWPLGPIGASALSGIEIALWDILGKSLGEPIWRLLGGKVRERVLVYTHLGLGDMRAVYDSLEVSDVIERAQAVVARGYRALKLVFIPYTHHHAPLPAVDRVGRMMSDLRGAVGDEIEVMVDFHGRPGSPRAALAYLEAIAPGRPMFVEEPLPPDDLSGLQVIAARSSVPLATGERLVSGAAFAALLATRAVDIVQPDLCHCGGFTAARAIAEMAATHGTGIAPHNPLGPIAGVAALHFAIATPNHVIQEEMVGSVPWYDEVVEGPIRMVDGHWQLPQAPGLGVTVNETACARHPFAPEIRHPEAAILSDGTVVDW